MGIYMVFLWTFHAALKIKCFLTGNVFSLLCISCGQLPRDPDPTPSCASMTGFCDRGKSYFFFFLPSQFSSLLNMYKQVGNQSLYVLCSFTQKCGGKRLGSCNLEKPQKNKTNKLFVSLTKIVFYSHGKEHAIFQCKLKVSDKRLIPY